MFKDFVIKVYKDLVKEHHDGTDFYVSGILGMYAVIVYFGGIVLISGSIGSFGYSTTNILCRHILFSILCGIPTIGFLLFCGIGNILHRDEIQFDTLKNIRNFLMIAWPTVLMQVIIKYGIIETFDKLTRFVIGEKPIPKSRDHYQLQADKEVEEVLNPLLLQETIKNVDSFDISFKL